MLIPMAIAAHKTHRTQSLRITFLLAQERTWITRFSLASWLAEILVTSIGACWTSL
jgi:hypothetical protein